MRTTDMEIKNGTESYESNYKRKINNLLDANIDLGLRGYVNFIHNSSYSTRFAYLNYVVNFLRYANKRKEDLTLDDYTEYICSIEDKTSSYQIAVYSAMKKLSSYLNATGIAKVDYMQHIPRPKFVESQKTKEKRENAYLNEKELQKYMSNVNDGIGSDIAKAKQEHWRTRDLLMIQIFLTTGMRCSALYRLDVDSLDLEKGTLATVDKGGQVQLHHLSESVIEIAKKWLIDRKLKGVSPNEKALFISNRLTRMHVNSIAKVVDKYAATVKKTKFSPHKLRATYGTHVYNKTKDVYLVQQCMGHSNPKTSELYIRGQKNASRERASVIMDNLLKQQ